MCDIYARPLVHRQASQASQLAGKQQNDETLMCDKCLHELKIGELNRTNAVIVCSHCKIHTVHTIHTIHTNSHTTAQVQ